MTSLQARNEAAVDRAAAALKDQLHKLAPGCAITLEMRMDRAGVLHETGILLQLPLEFEQAADFP